MTDGQISHLGSKFQDLEVSDASVQLYNALLIIISTIKCRIYVKMYELIHESLKKEDGLN